MTVLREDIGGWTYILASKPRGTLYTGSTRDLIARVAQHRTSAVRGFTQRYGVTRLVWFEPHARLAEAALLEQRIKRWRRAWKLALIEAGNPEWRDLWRDVAR